MSAHLQVFNTVKEHSAVQALVESMVNALILESSVNADSAYASSRFISALCSRLASRKWSLPESNEEVTLRACVLNACKTEFDTALAQVAISSPRALGFTFLLAELYMNLLLADGSPIRPLGNSLLELLQALASAITLSATTNFSCDTHSLDALLRILKLCGSKLHASHAEAVDKLLGALLALLIDCPLALNPQQRDRIVRLVHLHTSRWGQLESPALPVIPKLTFPEVPPPTNFALPMGLGADGDAGEDDVEELEPEAVGDDQDVIDDSYENFLLENEARLRKQ